MKKNTDWQPTHSRDDLSKQLQTLLHAKAWNKIKSLLNHQDAVFPNLNHRYYYANLLASLGYYDKAVSQFKTLISKKPTAAYWAGLGNLYGVQSDYPNAIIALQKAHHLAPKNPEIWYNLGMAYAESQQFLIAKDWFSKIPSHHQRFSEAQLELGFIALRNGDWKTGWRYYEHRLTLAPPHTILSPTKLWNGRDTVKTLLITAEQGYGDVLQFLRFVPALKARIPRLLWVGPKPMHRLLDWQHLFDDIFDKVPDNTLWDKWIPIGSLPYRTQLTPPDPFILRVPPATQAPWQAQLDPSRIRVGITWTGKTDNPRNQKRSIPCRYFRQLTSLPIQIVSLQAGPHAQDYQAERIRLTDLSPFLTRFDVTAQIIQNLDLIISVDTVVAHLAASCQKPVWLLLGFNSEWRWGKIGGPSAWYPTMEQFQTRHPNQWNPLIRTVYFSLKRSLNKIRQQIT